MLFRIATPFSQIATPKANSHTGQSESKQSSESHQSEPKTLHPNDPNLVLSMYYCTIELYMSCWIAGCPCYIMSLTNIFKIRIHT